VLWHYRVGPERDGTWKGAGWNCKPRRLIALPVELGMRRGVFQIRWYKLACEDARLALSRGMLGFMCLIIEEGVSGEVCERLGLRRAQMG